MIQKRKWVVKKEEVFVLRTPFLNLRQDPIWKAILHFVRINP